MLDRDHIVKLLHTNDRAVARAIVALSERQAGNQFEEWDPRHRAGRGFRHCHARLGTSMAKFVRENGGLSSSQLAYWRERQRDGRSRIEVYANQLLEIARERAESQSKYPMQKEPIYVEARVVDKEPEPMYNTQQHEADNARVLHDQVMMIVEEIRRLCRVK